MMSLRGCLESKTPLFSLVGTPKITRGGFATRENNVFTLPPCHCIVLLLHITSSSQTRLKFIIRFLKLPVVIQCSQLAVFTKNITFMFKEGF
jgi:hypothetical protein